MPIYAIPLKKKWALGFFASAITHPVVWFVIPHFVPLSNYAVYLFTAEIFAFVTEGIYLSLIRVPQAFLWALLANSVSAGAGLIYWFFIH